MPHFKDANGKLYFLDNNENKLILPNDCVEVSDEEANNLMPQSQYHTVKSDGSGCEITPENQELKDADEAEATRVIEIKAEQESSGLKQITVAQAHDKIDQIFEGKTTAAQIRTATISALKKVIPYILR